MLHRQVTQAGIDLIRHFEGFSASIYKDSAGYPSIGVGHLIRPSESFSEPITEQEAEELLKKDLWTAERAVLRLTKVPLEDNQYNALTSFVFNVGSGAYQRSTLRARINRLELTEETADEFLKWIFAGKRIIKGLLRRRIAERDMFLR